VSSVLSIGARDHDGKAPEHRGPLTPVKSLEVPRRGARAAAARDPVLLARADSAVSKSGREARVATSEATVELDGRAGRPA
jgi:hypothetical protein